MKVEVVGTAKDMRTNTPVVYAKLSIPDYLELVGPDFEKFQIQRRRQKHKAYIRMKRDIVDGALLPPITLAIKPQFVKELQDMFDRQDFAELGQTLAQPDHVNILDGLQRTYILNDLQNENTEFKKGQIIFVEFWLEGALEHLIYRIIVLNAGQKPMSMRHQIELLFLTLKGKIEEQITGLQLYTERDTTRRRGSRKYALDRVATAYQSFITKTPEIERENVVAQMLSETDVFDSDEDELQKLFDSFLIYLGIYADLDDQICRIYQSDTNTGIPTGANWFGSDNVMNSFFAAIAQLTENTIYRDRVSDSLVRLKDILSKAQVGEDPLGLATLNGLIDGFNPRKINVGFATRTLLTNGFKEFFREAGGADFSSCWVRVTS